MNLNFLDNFAMGTIALGLALFAFGLLLLGGNQMIRLWR